ncbi:hypothetical protein Tcan_02570, partial [Toxocara canis]
SFRRHRCIFLSIRGILHERFRISLVGVFDTGDLRFTALSEVNYFCSCLVLWNAIGLSSSFIAVTPLKRCARYYGTACPSFVNHHPLASRSFSGSSTLNE